LTPPFCVSPANRPARPARATRTGAGQQCRPTMLNDLGHPFLSPIVRRDAKHRKGRLPQRLLLETPLHMPAANSSIFRTTLKASPASGREDDRPASDTGPLAGLRDGPSSPLTACRAPDGLKPKTSENIRACRSSSDSVTWPSCSIARNADCSLRPKRLHMSNALRCFGFKSWDLIMLPPS
jgi:hypothetical protein